MKNNILYRTLCLVLIALCSVMASGQTEHATVPQVIPPSPTVRGLCKYGEIPVDYSTGIPDITIPLYTLKCGSLELPITLNYHAGGIRVDEAASWVGLGWSLKAGGTIGVTTNGYNDCFSFPYDIPTFEELQEGYFNGYTSSQLNEWHIYQATHDTHPDIFSYSIGGHSGQFLYDLKERKFYDANGQKNLKITHAGGNSDYHFVAYDRKGNRYLLDEKETLTVTGGNPWTFDTAWNLSKMVSASGCDSISFDYGSPKTERETVMLPTSRTFGLDQEEEWHDGWHCVNSTADTYLGSRLSINSTTRTYNTRKMETIVASNGLSVEFNMVYGRMDLHDISGAPAAYLSSIVVKDASGNRIRKWEFQYGHFVSYMNNSDDSTAAYRLKLAALKEYGTDDSDVNVYRFSYYGEEAGEPQMPYRHSFAGKDAWGFCNGQPTPAQAKDFLKAYPNFQGVHFNMYKSLAGGTVYNRNLAVSNTTGEDKAANALYMHTYSLRRITYPTGGYSEFVYEPNHFSCTDNFATVSESFEEEYTAIGAGQRIKEIITHDGKRPNRRTFTYSEGELPAMPHFIQRKVYQTPAGIWGVAESEKPKYNDEVRTYLEMYPAPYNTVSLSNGSNVGYTTVTEHFEEGRTVYDYTPHNMSYQSYSVVTPAGGSVVDCVEYGGYVTYASVNMPTERTSDRYNSFHGLYGTCFNRGLLSGKRTYDNRNRLLHQEVLTYNHSRLHRIPGIDFQRIPGMVNFLGYTASTGTQAVEPSFAINFYWHMVGLSQLTKKVATEYTYDGNMQKTHVTTTHYTYNADNLLASTRTVDSCGDSVVVNTLYPSDIPSAAFCQGMVEKNMLDYPIETVRKHNGSTVSAGLTLYGLFGGGYYPSAYYTYRPSAPDAAFTPFGGSVQSEYGTPDAVITHYEHGRIASMKGKDNVVNNYLWGYHWEYPIAEIRGIPYSVLTSVLTPSAYGSMSTVPTSTLTSLRSLFTTAQVSCYSYLPGIGMQYMQGADKGVRKFGYDSLGRFSEFYRGEDFSNVRLTEKHTYHTINE